MQPFLDLQHFFCHWQGGIQPVDFNSAALHSTKPCHLSLGKLMNSRFKIAKHLRVSQFTKYILRQKLIWGEGGASGASGARKRYIIEIAYLALLALLSGGRGLGRRGREGRVWREEALDK